MDKTVKTFLKRIVILSLIISTIGFLLFFFVIPQYYLKIFPFTLLFFFTITVGSFLFLQRANKKKFSNYSAKLTVLTMLKMLSFLTFIIVYSAIYTENAATFVSAFFGMYVIYSIALNHALVDLNDSNKEE